MKKFITVLTMTVMAASTAAYAGNYSNCVPNTNTSNIQVSVKPVGITSCVLKPALRPTETTTQAVTEKPTETTTQAVTEKPTETTTQAVTEKPTETTTQAVTEKPTETTTQAVTEKPTETTTVQTSDSYSSMEMQVIELVNQERAKNGLSALKMDTELMNAARLKSEDMKNNNYFSHTSPTYGSPFDMLKSLGISYNTAGENIAKGQKTAEAVVNAWMNSDGHRKNILNSAFTSIGVSYVDGYWTQLFKG